jgi:GAF domain-containing protein
MADQLAVALDNAILLERYQESVRDLEQVGERYTRDIMRRLDESQRFPGYEFGTDGVKPIKTEEDDSFAPIHIPLKVRGETVASIEVWPTKAGISPAEYDFLNDLGGRLGQAIESARLFEDAQSQASREQVLNEFISRLSQSLDLDALMQLAVKELAKMPNVNEVSIQLNMPENGASEDEH